MQVRNIDKPLPPEQRRRADRAIPADRFGTMR
jgi:hypothetical protein